MIHWAEFIITGVKKDIGSEDQQNFDMLWSYVLENVNDPVWKCVRTDMYTIATQELE